MTSVLFVDDEHNVLDGLKRGLRKKSKEWQMHFVASGEEALNFLSQSPCDVIVSDMRMPKMNGAELLREVSEKKPDTIRIILSGYSEVEYIMQAVRYTHQFLAKPCDTDEIISAIARATNLRKQLNSDRLKELVTGLQTLPSLPANYIELSKVLESEDVSIKEVADIISKDLGMSAKVLQLSNSAYFVGNRKISDITKAIEILGYETIRLMVLAISAFSQVDSKSIHGSTFARVFSHSLKVGKLALLIAKDLSDKKSFHDDSFIAGILHDIGKIILISNMSDEYNEAVKKARKSDISSYEAEMSVFGVSHGVIGAYLLELWGLRDDIIEAVANHNIELILENPVIVPQIPVYLANLIEHSSRGDRNINPEKIDSYLKNTGVGKTFEEVKKLCTK